MNNKKKRKVGNAGSKEKLGQATPSCWLPICSSFSGEMPCLPSMPGESVFVGKGTMLVGLQKHQRKHCLFFLAWLLFFS